MFAYSQSAPKAESQPKSKGPCRDFAKTDSEGEDK